MAELSLYLMLVAYLILSTFNFVLGNSISCSFESDLCGWQSAGTGKFQWKRGSGLTEDRTSGPLNDHTCANYQGEYMFISGGDAVSHEDTAVLESQVFTLINDTTFSFWYIMNGYGTGTLTLSSVKGNISSEIWSKTGRQGKNWMKQSLTLKSGTLKLRFKSTVRIPVGSDLAVDDIQLFSESQPNDTKKIYCQTTTSTTTTTTTSTTTTTLPTTTTAERMNKTHKISSLTTFSSSSPSSSISSCLKVASKTEIMPGTCDFEKDTCGIKITANNSNKIVTWERTNKIDGNEYQNDSILGDHTFEKNNTKGVYLVFRNAFSFFNSKLIASFETPAIYATYACLSFWYIVPTGYSNLKVSIRDYRGRLTPIWSVDNFIPSKRVSNRTGWHEKSLSIFQDPPFTVVFQAYNNMHYAKVGVDDIKIIGANITTGRTKPASDRTTQVNHTPDTTPHTTSIFSSPAATLLHTTSYSSTTDISSNTKKPGNISTKKSQAVASIETSTKLMTGSTVKQSKTTEKGGKKTTMHSTKKHNLKPTSKSVTGSMDKVDKSTTALSTMGHHFNKSSKYDPDSNKEGDKTTTVKMFSTEKPRLKTTPKSVTDSAEKGTKKTIEHTTKKPTKIEFNIGDKGKQTEEDKYEKTSTIVGSVVGAVMGLVLLIVVVYFIVQYKSKEKTRRRKDERKTENQQNINGRVSNGGFSSGTYVNAPVSNGHAGNGTDIFTAYSLNMVNTFTAQKDAQVNGDARLKGHESAGAEEEMENSVRL